MRKITKDAYLKVLFSFNDGVFRIVLNLNVIKWF